MLNTYYNSIRYLIEIKKKNRFAKRPWRNGRRARLRA